MRRHFKWDKTYLYWGITAFCVIAASVLFYMALRYMPDLGNALGSLVRVLSPFICGFVITYLLSPMTDWMQRNVFGPIFNKLGSKKDQRSGTGFARGLAVFISEVVLLAIIAALIYLILPQLYSSIETIVVNSNDYIKNLGNWIENLFSGNPEIEAYVVGLVGDLNSGIFDWVRTTLLPGLGGVVTNVTAGVRYVVSAVYNLIIGIIVSAYILGDMEHFKAAAKKLLYCVFSLENAERIRSGIRFTDKTFIGFINGKLLDSAIIGLICYIVCAILDMPYALLVSVIVGVTNIIPFFGPFIGAVPSALIILMVNPLKSLIFIVFIIVLQQLDGNFIGPKILGSSVGISGFWVMFSIIVGAGFFGFWGMLLGVPVFVVIYTAVNIAVDKKLKKSDLPVETAQYADIERIDPITHEVTRSIKVKKDADSGSGVGESESRVDKS